MTNVADVAKCGRIMVSDVEVRGALATMGLSAQELHQAIDAGEVDRDHCNEFNPPSDAEHRAHGTTTRVMREIYVPKGWTPCDWGNFSTIISPDGSIEIAVASGDSATGNPHYTPQTQWKKGERATLGIERNNQLFLFDYLSLATDRNRHSAGTTWFLLRYRTEREVQCELSIPTESVADKPEDLKKRVFFGGTRIILPILDIGPRGGIRPRDEDEPSRIDVAVKRRQA